MHKKIRRWGNLGRPLGTFWSLLGALLGILGTLLGRSWKPHGGLLGLFEASWTPLGKKLGKKHVFWGSTWHQNPPNLAPESWKNRCEKTMWFRGDFFPFFSCCPSIPTSKQDGQFCKKIKFSLGKITIFALLTSSWSSKSGSKNFSKTSILGPKNLPKWRSKSIKIDLKLNI